MKNIVFLNTPPSPELEETLLELEYCILQAAAISAFISALREWKCQNLSDSRTTERRKL